VTLNLASQDGIYAQRVDALLVIQNDLTIIYEGGRTVVSPDQQLNYAAVLPLLHQTLRRAAINADDSLDLGRRAQVPTPSAVGEDLAGQARTSLVHQWVC
jgi:hypothetical protein